MKTRITILLLLAIVSINQLNAQYWKKIETLPTGYEDNYWLDIYFLPTSPNFGWACGFRGQVVRTTNGGATWSGSTISGAHHLESVHFVTSQIGYTSGVEGIFKSTNGGATWEEISPDPLQTYWGCYFVDANNGLVVGGGCGNGIQRFYRTSDGGETWTLFLGNEPNSGMTDVMLYPNGTGYAASSGKIWKSTDAGWTWAVHSTTGPNFWQEEITNLGNSFLVPTAGNSCTGAAGPAGGMRFSTDYGVSWNVHSVSNSMFGTFLLGPTIGWACGYDGQVYYTTNAGVNWVSRNCGIERGHLDDIWFNTPTDGWVVGQGIWKLSPAESYVSPQVLNWDTLCIPNTKLDTIWIRNLSFNSALATFSLTGTDANSFSMVYPNSLQETIGICDSFPIIIRFNPQTLGQKNAQFNINLNSQNKTVQLVGFAAESSIQLAEAEQVIDNAPCGLVSYANFQWRAEDSDRIISIEKISGVANIRSTSNLPLVIDKFGTLTQFEVIPLDTGWVTADFHVLSLPCNKEHIVKVRAYGTSPIITADDYINIQNTCFKDSILAIPIHNTGNALLRIEQVLAAGDMANYSLIGWSSGVTLGEVNQINFGNSDTLLIKFNTEIPGSYDLDITLINNDSTKARGNKNPFVIRLRTTSSFPILEPKIAEFDFGNVCISETKVGEVTIFNSGDISAEVVSFHSNNDVFKLISTNAIINQNGSARLQFSFTPIMPGGDFSDTISIVFAPCNSIIQVVLKGFGVDNNVIIQPSLIKEFVQTNIPLKRTISIKSIANTRQLISAIELQPELDNIIISITPELPYLLEVSESVEFELTFIAKEEAVYEFLVCVHLESECRQTICIPTEITAKSRYVDANPKILDFGLLTCEPKEQTLSTIIQNFALERDTIIDISIEQTFNYFQLVNPPALPYFIEPNEQLELTISFLPIDEGVFDGKVLIKTIEPAGQTIEIALNADFKTTKTSINRNSINFGTYEYCEENRIEAITFSNQGLLADTLQLIYTDTNGFVISHESYIIVPSQSTELLNIQAIISELNIGLNTIEIIVKSIVCEKEFVINAQIEVIKPMLRIEPTEFDFGNVWAEVNKSLELQIINESGVSKEFKIVGILPEPNDFRTEQAEQTLQSGDSTTITVEFFSLVEGLHNATLFISEYSKCYDTTIVPLRAFVPEEHYYPIFRVGDYQRMPGDTLTMYVSLDTLIHRTIPTKAEFTLDFDKNLFEPKSIEAVYSIGGNIPFTLLNNKLKFDIEGRLANDLLLKEGNKFGIFGQTLLSLPDSTPVKFSPSIKISANKKVTALEENGSLKIYGYCTPTAGLRYQIMPTIEIQSVYANNDFIDIKLTNTSKQNVSFLLVALSGKIVLSETLEIQSGEEQIKLNISNQASGIYYLLTSTNYHQKILDKILLIR